MNYKAGDLVKRVTNVLPRAGEKRHFEKGEVARVVQEGSPFPGMVGVEPLEGRFWTHPNPYLVGMDEVMLAVPPPVNNKEGD